MKASWSEGYDAWSKRDLSGKRYVYIWADGIHFNVRLGEDGERACILVIMGATSDGVKELIAVDAGIRESTTSWKGQLLQLKRQGLTTAPELAICDGALGLWAALSEVFSTTKQQRYWVHKTGNVLDKLPKSAQPQAKKMLRVFYITSTISFALFVVVKNYRETKNLPSASFLLPIVIFSIWWIPTFVQNDFYWQLVPFFHSLQYLCFVRRSEVANWDNQQMNSRPDYYIRFACYTLFIIVIGWLTFEMIPSLMDHNRSAARVEGIAFFYVCLTVFINIHHYFIDNVLWRFRDSQVAQRLFVS